MTVPLRLLPEKITVRAYLGAGGDGPVYGDEETIPARIQRTRRVVRDKFGAEVVAEATVYVPAGTEVTPESDITVDGDSRTIVAVAPHVGAHTTAYVEVSLA